MAAAGVGYVLVSSARAVEADVVELLQAAEAELRREQPDRTAIAPLLRRMAEHERAEDARLLRARAGLELALGRPHAAWKVLETLVLRAEVDASTLQLAARVHTELHALRGDVADVDRAMTFARQHYELTGDVESLFIAWQSARRGGRAEETREFVEQLTSRHPESVQARIAAAVDAGASLAALQALEREVSTSPVELEFMIAVRLLEDEGGNVDEAIDRITAVLRAYPASIDARNLAALAYHRAGARERRDGHLDWLLKNAPADDRRRETWMALRAMPAQGS
jgi:tetratricopeptide (TPR) repeat protein